MLFIALGNQYKIYPHPDIGTTCDVFLWILLWIKWVEMFHLDCPMKATDFMFPAVGANSILCPGESLIHDTIQKWIGQSVAGAKISGSFSMHCFRHGGAQFWFMYAPIGQQWTLVRV